METTIATPGRLLGTAAEYRAGTGVYEEKGKLYAGISGRVMVTAGESGAKSVAIAPAGCDFCYPQIGEIVYGIVVDISKMDAKVEILARENEPLRHGQKYVGIIRCENIRDYEIDKIVVEECLVPGDVVKARIV